jgi:hypothetical protein
MYPHPSEVSGEVSRHCKEGAEFSAALKAMTPIFNRNRFVVRVVGFLALLISFGVVFPPLGVVMALAIVSISYFEQLNIGRILHESGELGYGWYREKLGYDVSGMVESVMTTVLPMTMVASLLFGALVFDTIGDKGGFGDGLIAGLLMSLVPSALYVVFRSSTLLEMFRMGRFREDDEMNGSMHNVELHDVRLTSHGH